jgi:hypothetical protein
MPCSLLLGFHHCPIPLGCLRMPQRAFVGTGNQMPCLLLLGFHPCPIPSGCLRTSRLLSLSRCHCYPTPLGCLQTPHLLLLLGCHRCPILLGCLPVCSQVIPRRLIVASSYRTSVGRRGTNQLRLVERYLDVLVKHTTEIPPPTALVEVRPRLP